jgi:hypothetical protein
MYAWWFRSFSTAKIPVSIRVADGFAIKGETGRRRWCFRHALSGADCRQHRAVPQSLPNPSGMGKPDLGKLAGSLLSAVRFHSDFMYRCARGKLSVFLRTKPRTLVFPPRITTFTGYEQTR